MRGRLDRNRRRSLSPYRIDEMAIFVAALAAMGRKTARAGLPGAAIAFRIPIPSYCALWRGGSFDRRRISPSPRTYGRQIVYDAAGDVLRKSGIR